MEPAWKDHMEALRRFNAWEVARLRERPPDLGSALRWLSEAWDLAERYGPRESPEARRERHLEELLRLRRALERARLSS